jgi:hypothetical protein
MLGQEQRTRSRGDPHPVEAPNRAARSSGGRVPTGRGWGKFAIKDLAAGDYVLSARLKGTGNAKQRITVADGETTTVKLSLTPPKKAGEKQPKKAAGEKQAKKAAAN